MAGRSGVERTEMTTDLFHPLPSIRVCLEHPLQTTGHLGTALPFASSHHLCFVHLLMYPFLLLRIVLLT